MATTTVAEKGELQMSKEEKKFYDRQIRLWGYDGQIKIGALSILLIGLQGLGAEIAKNMILSGIKAITLKDHTDESILDRCSQFLIPRGSEERNRAKASLAAAQKLNPNVKVIADTKPIEEDDDDFVGKFDIVIATECSPQTYNKLHMNCQKNHVKLFIADVFGLFGYFFQDIDDKGRDVSDVLLYDKIFPNYDPNNTISIPKDRPLPYYLTTALLRFQHENNRKPNPDTCEEDIEEIKSIISSFELEKPKLDDFEEYYSELFCELSPATSIVGAMVSQTATRTEMGSPILNYNVFFFDHITHEGKFHKF